MKILVTGGAGFIGSHITKKLLDRGDEVVCIDNFDGDFYSPKIKELNIAPFLSNPNYKLYRKDISNFEDLKEIFEKEKIKRICHCAAKVGVVLSLKNPFLYEKANTLGTINLLELSKDYGIENFEEDKTDNIISPYGVTKKSTELWAYSYHNAYKLNINIIRPFNIYGPSGRPDMIPFKFTKLIDEGKEITQYGDGTMQRDHTYIDDFVEGIVSAIDQIFGFEIFNIGNSRPVDLSYFIQVVENILGKKAKIKKVEIPSTEVPITYADISKAREMLGYNPKTKIEDGMKIFVDWYKKNKHLYK
jgi:UDP-glucuronate 4-epimerase